MEIENSNTIDVKDLWCQIEAMEKERRFEGSAYPEGLCTFPFKLKGQGFFPGGDGLWRQDSQLQFASPGTIRQRGVMFLGNDFGTLKTYETLRSNGYENPPTWRNLKSRIRRANIPTDFAFFTNSVLGLRSAAGSKALDKRAWHSSPQFARFCQDFLCFQVEALAPRLIVVLGPNARSSLEAFGVPISAEMTSLARIGGHQTLLHCTTHPYGDFNFSESRKAEDAAGLHLAWQQASAASTELTGRLR